uniref:Phytocyanin domain-containing protein n=1 Tax=Daucus carota subsp. sativus TaxID=79200 RepID=A0A164X370_DAUCS
MASSVAGIVCLISIFITAVPSLGKDYTVGDSSGWALSVDYSTWATGKTFNVGDNLGQDRGSAAGLSSYFIWFYFIVVFVYL